MEGGAEARAAEGWSSPPVVLLHRWKAQASGAPWFWEPLFNTGFVGLNVNSGLLCGLVTPSADILHQLNQYRTRRTVAGSIGLR